MYRIPFDKQALLKITPEPWPDTPDRLVRFSTWLGRRSGRAAIPDPIVRAFVRPLGKVLQRLKKREPDAYRAFNMRIEDIRIALPSSERPPFTINMVLLLDGPELTDIEDDTINHVCDTLRQRLDPTQAELGDVIKLTRSRMSVDLYFATALVDLEAVSFEGEEPIGATPSPLP